MSDKINTVIQDRGWNDMRSILDTELPVKHKKKRFFIWFKYAGAAISIIAAVTLINLWKSNTDSSISDFVNVDKSSNSEISVIETLQGRDKSLTYKEVKSNNISNNELAIAKTQQNISSTEISSNVNSKENKIQSVVENNLKSDELGVHRSLITKEMNPLEIARGTIVQKQRINNTNSEISIHQPTPEIADRKYEPEFSPENVKTLGPIDQISEERLFLTPFLILPTSKLLPLNMERLGYEFMNPVIDIKKDNSISPYLFAGTNYQSNINGLGYELGIGLNYGNEDFGIYLETGYFRSKYNSGELSNDFAPYANVEVSNDVGITDPVGFNNLEFGLIVSNFSELTTSIDELKVGLGIRKQMFKRFHLDFGLSYAKLLNANNKSLTVKIESAAELDSDGNFAIVKSSELYETGAYSSFDIVPHIGVEYAFNSNIYADISYNHGLKNLIKNRTLDRLYSISENDEIYRRNIAARIRYQF